MQSGGMVRFGSKEFPISLVSFSQPPIAMVLNGRLKFTDWHFRKTRTGSSDDSTHGFGGKGRFFRHSEKKRDLSDEVTDVLSTTHWRNTEWITRPAQVRVKLALNYLPITKRKISKVSQIPSDATLSIVFDLP